MNKGLEHDEGVFSPKSQVANRRARVRIARLNVRLETMQAPDWKGVTELL